MNAAGLTMRCQKMKGIESKRIDAKDSCGDLIQGLSLTLNDQE